MDSTSILNERMRNQRLVGARFSSPEEAVGSLLAVQSQDFAGAKWGIGQRTHRATDASIERAYDEGRILRTHVLRPTWHFVLPDDINWLLALTAPRVRKLLVPYDRQLEIDADLRKKSTRLLSKWLRYGQHLTRAELSQRYGAAGIEAKGQRLAHLVMHAELDGIMCSGPMRGKHFTYALLDERVPQARALRRDDAIVELVRRFLAGHGPATVKDCAWWSGLTQADIRAGVAPLGDALRADEYAGATYYASASTRPSAVRHPALHLLPNYDEYLVGYRDRSVFLDRTTIPPIRNDALAEHFVVLDGRVIGGWRRSATKEGFHARAQLFGGRRTTVVDAVRSEFARIGKFTGKAVTVDIEIVAA